MNPATKAGMEIADKAQWINMDTVRGLVPLFIFGIFFVAVLTYINSNLDSKLDARINPIDKKITKIEKRMDSFEIRMDSLEKRMDSFEIRMDSLEKRMENLEAGQVKILTILEKIKPQSSKK